MNEMIFTTAKVTLFDRITEFFKMRKYMREFNRAKAERAKAMDDIRSERKPLAL